MDGSNQLLRTFWLLAAIAASVAAGIAGYFMAELAECQTRPAFDDEPSGSGLCSDPGAVKAIEILLIVVAAGAPIATGVAAVRSGRVLRLVIGIAVAAGALIALYLFTDESGQRSVIS